jgi:UDP-sugar transporter A1/2/3
MPRRSPLPGGVTALQSPPSAPSSEYSRTAQLLACAVLVLANSANVLTLRVSRTRKTHEQGYIMESAVVMAECMKIVLSTVLYYRDYMNTLDAFEGARSLATFPRHLFDKIFVNWRDTLHLAVPGGIYYVQNVVLVFALSKLDSVTFQISYQLKILTTALFTVLVLHRPVSPSKWAALSLLMMGVVLVQYPKDDATTIDNSPEDIAERSDPTGTLLGLLAVLVACLSSGFAGVYFEKMVSGVKNSLWLRNIQLALVAITLGMPFTLLSHWTEIVGSISDATSAAGAGAAGAAGAAGSGFFRGFNVYVWTAVVFQATAGIAVALVIKYAGNLTKCLASAVAIIVSTVISYFVLNDVTLTPQFVWGGVVVVLSVFLYNLEWVS